jgi:DNA helicase-2/ATP-dependent DNA helicase PcrA
MSEPHLPEIVVDEQALLVRTVRLLHEVPVLAPPKEDELVAELLRLREEVNNAKEEDKPSMLQQYDQQLALLEQIRAGSERPVVDPASPYFAHLRLDEDGHERDLFLGKGTRIDHGLRIVDWRNAPISRIFYSYQQGEDYEENFGGRVMEGTVVARRTVGVEQSILRRIESPEGSFVRLEDDSWTLRTRERPRLAGGQGSALATVHEDAHAAGRTLGQDAHGRPVRADKHLPDIAGLLDPEQFELITRPSSGFVVIRGTAGSGKTTVALHRIAWLAYDDPSVDSDRTLFLAFSRALRDYVERVLPALGVAKVRPITFPAWAAQMRRRHFPKLPQVINEDTPEVVLRLKSHPATMVALERHIEATDGLGTMEQAIDDWLTVLTRPDVLLPVFDELDPGGIPREDLERAIAWSRERGAELMNALDEDVEKEDKVAVFMDAEDDPILLRAWQKRVGPLRDKGQRPLRYKHIAVDEVQDFSPIEVRVLLDCLDEKRSITLAGDTQQHVMASAGFTSWSTFFGWLGVEGVEVETLRIAYRSSEPIVTFANRLLGDVNEDDTPPLTVRSGPPVEVFRFTDPGAAVGFLADALQQLARAEPLASVAVIAPNESTAQLYYDGLKRGEVPRLRLVQDEAFSFSPGVEVVDVRQVKGLEFDYVLLVDVSARSYPDTPSSRRLLHVAATRAIHQLWVTCVGTPSSILREAVEDQVDLA